MSIADKLTTIAENEEKVFTAGKTAEYDAFWDSFQNYGNKTSYWGAFAYWKDDIYKPKYTIRAASTNYMFYNSTIADTGDIYVNTNQLHTILYYSQVKNTHITLEKDITYVSLAFENAPNLTDVVIDGTGKITVSFSVKQSTQLTKASITSFVGALSDSVTDKTVTLSRTAKEREFTEEEWAELIGTKPNWTISLA